MSTDVIVPSEPRPGKRMRLTKEQRTAAEEAFCVEYVRCNNAKDAFLHAYPYSKKWKIGTVYTRASLLLAKEKIQKRVTQLRDEIALAAQEQLLVEVRHQVQRHLTVLQTDIKDFYTDDGPDGSLRAKRLEELTPEQRFVIQEVRLRPMGSVTMKGKGPNGEPLTKRIYKDTAEYKLLDKSTSMAAIDKYVGLYAEDNKQKAQALVEQLDVTINKIEHSDDAVEALRDFEDVRNGLVIDHED